MEMVLLWTEVWITEHLTLTHPLFTPVFIPPLPHPLLSPTPPVPVGWYRHFVPVIISSI